MFQSTINIVIKFLLGVITINIEIKKRNRLKEFSNFCHDHAENLMFEVIQKVPEKFIPKFLMCWLDKYTAKRIFQLKQQIIKDQWKEIELEKAVNDIHSNS